MANPLASGLQCGARSPENAGTKNTPSESSTVEAISLSSSNEDTMPKLSLSHLKAAPAIPAEPSSA